MSQEYSSGVLLILGLLFSVISAFASSPYIVGLAYYKLGSKNVTVTMPATISSNTALIITLYETYQSSKLIDGFWQQEDAAINITGPGRKNIKIIIWATYKNVLHFSSN